MYGIYANIGGILMVNVTIYIYIPYMDPMGNTKTPPPSPQIVNTVDLFFIVRGYFILGNLNLKNRFRNQLNFLIYIYITQLIYCPKLDFEVEPEQQMKNPKKQIVFIFYSISKSIKFPCTTQLKYYPK